MTDGQIRYLVDRFLMWKLPEHFNPDCGISFDQTYRSAHGPVGTNLFDANQATEMVRYMLDEMPDHGKPDEAVRETLDTIRLLQLEIVELNQILDWDVAAALDPAVSGRKA